MVNLKAVLTRPKVSENYARNAFDRSFSVNTSYQLGGLEPFFCEPFIAGSHVKLNRSIFQRTADVNTAAFPKVDTHCEFFAVPIRLLWAYWNNFKLNIQDFNSSNFGSIVASSQQFTPNSPSLSYFDIHSVLKQLNQELYATNAAQPSSFWGYASQNTLAARAANLGAMRLLAGLGYGCYPHSDMSTLDTGNQVFTVNPLKLLAYQKVYYDHFRNTAYESNDPSFYNMDDLAIAGSIANLRLGKFMTYRYVNYRKDYMYSHYPALNYTASLPSGSSWVISDSVLYQDSNGTNVSDVQVRPVSGGQTSFTSPIFSTINSSISSVQQIRASFALDKLLRASAYTPKHVKDQFEARYGVKGVESGNESVRIGAFMNDIIIQEVVNQTAGTGSGGYSGLGMIGGKGVGYNGFGKDIEFTCKEDCIILGVMYSLPRTSFDGTFIKNWNAKLDREDFFIPEYMNLSMQPFNQYELTFMNYNGNVYQPNFSTINSILGYKERYSEYKLGIDVNLGNFLRGGALSDFVVHSNSRYSYTGTPAYTADYFKVKPWDMDDVFAQATDTSDITTDKFITHIDVKCICNQNMSVHGQPRNGGLG